MGDAGRAALKLVATGAQRPLLAELRDAPLLGDATRFHDYIHALLSREAVNQFRVLFLDGRNCLLLDEVQGTGTVDHAPAYPREIARRTLELNASALILVHNHPAGHPTRHATTSPPRTRSAPRSRPSASFCTTT